MWNIFRKKSNSAHLTQSDKIKNILVCATLMAFGLFVFKYIPMSIWGGDILYDASLHITATIFVLYVLWYFIDQNESWRVPFFVFSFMVISIVAMQRILADAHSDVGLLLGLVISIVSILISRWRYFKGKFSF